MKKFFLFLAAVALAMTANAKVTTISPDAENDALRLAVHYAEDGDIIEMTEGTYVQCNNGYVAFDGKSVTVKAAEGANVVLQLQVPITITNGGKANLQGIKIDASRLNDLADWYEHVIYANDATEVKELVMQGCELYGFNINKSAIYSSSSNTLALCDVKDCYFHDNMKSCFFFEGASIAELSVVNSTFANIATDATGYYAGIVDVRNADAKVTVDHCTFYNCLIINTDYAAVTMKGPQAANVVIANNIFMLPEAIDGHRAIRNDVEATNCMTFNYVKDNGGIHSSVTKTNCFLNVDPMFVDAANGNFALEEGSPALGAGTDGSNLGDPRWNAPAEEAKEPIELYADVTFTVDESGDLNLVGEANTGEVIDIWVASWADNGYGEYAAGDVWGTIDGVHVANMSEAVTIEQERLVAYVYALLEGSDGNIYNLTAGGMALADPSQGGEGEEDDTKLTVNDADIAPSIVNTSDLELYGYTSDWKEINVVLKNGTTKLYGDYTAEELEIKVNWEEATLATGTVASYYELEGVAVFEATVLLGEKTYELTISGTPWVDPSTIVPTETIELEFANAEIKYQYGGLNITAANGDASLVLKINTTADAMYGSFTFDDLFQFVSSVVVGDDEISFIYGTVVVEKVKEGEYTYDKVTTSLLGANHKLYNMVATTTPKSTPTGLDNIDTTVAPAKVINNGQLIIIRNGVQYNAQGAIVK